MILYGGVKKYNSEVPEKPLSSYPEAYVYGRILPASGFYFRFIKNLSLENVKVKTIYLDKRQTIIQEYVK